MLTCFGPHGVLFLPQRPFFTDGSLREQVSPGPAGPSPAGLLPCLCKPACSRKACKREDACGCSFPFG